MDSPWFWIRARLVPAVITALGVSIVAVGVLTYTYPSDVGAAPPPTTPPTAGTAAASARPRPTFPPIPTPGPSGSAGPTTSVATRVVVPLLKIDLPVVAPPRDPTAYPYCNVAEYVPNLSQPGEPGATYLYAHARTGMFLPILDASLVKNGARLIGMFVYVYTSDNQVYLYEITEVHRHQITLDLAYAAKDEVLMLQTSEGPKGTPGKTVVVARPLSHGPADPAAAHPRAKPVDCE